MLRWRNTSGSKIRIVLDPQPAVHAAQGVTIHFRSLVGAVAPGTDQHGTVEQQEQDDERGYAEEPF